MISKSTTGPLTSEQIGECLAGLTDEVRELRSRVDILLSLIDPDDIRAAAELARITPTNAELKAIATICNPPPELLNSEEEKPW